MKTFVVYNPVTGDVRAKYSVSETQDIRQQMRTGEAILEGEFDVQKDLVDMTGPKPIKRRKPEDE